MAPQCIGPAGLYFLHFPDKLFVKGTGTSTPAAASEVLVYTTNLLKNTGTILSMAWIKRTLIALLVVFLLLAGAVAWLLAGLDINQYKPQLEKLAAKQGISLQLQGDIGWQIWPQVGLQLRDITMAPLQLPEEILVRADKIAVGVALKPLLQRRVEAEEIVLIAPQIELSVDKEGRGNWELISEALEAQKKQPPKLEIPRESEEPAQQQVELSLDKLRIEQGLLSYSDARTTKTYKVEDLSISADNLVPGGEPGQLSANANVSGSDLRYPLKLKLDSTLALDEGLNGLRLQPLQLIVTSSNSAKATVHLRGYVRRENGNQPWRVQMNLNASADPLRPWLDLTGSEVVTRDSAVLQKLNIEASIEGTEQKLNLTPLQLQLDGTTFNGSAQLRNAEMPGLDLSLRGGVFNLDSYLPPSDEESGEEGNKKSGEPVTKAPSTEATAQSEESTQTPTSAETLSAQQTEKKSKAGTQGKTAQQVPGEPLPLSDLRGFNANISLALDQLQAAGLQLDSPEIQLTVDNGLYQLQKLSADLYGGQLNSNGQFNARAQTAEGQVRGGLTGVDIGKVQEALFPSEKVQVTGEASVNWDGRTKGKTSTDLQENLRAAVNLSSKELSITPFNLEKSMCQLFSYAESTPMPDRDWPAQTDLQDLRATIAVKGEEVNVTEILAGIENIAMTGDGEIDLKKQDFDFALGLALVGENTSADGCSVKNKRWRNRPLPLRCKGDFNDVGPGTCKPDSRRIDDLVREELKYKAKKKYGDKVEEKVDELKEKLKNLFGR
ncbi:AsmA family protein [uncultured Microbulbifer sp.]|uniref:AsmA family protein n=1 Tax=uncultured Microbulbifer sp. TaxID=348147 RepID=UPI00260E066E|nr:AsmA family protein [uncultured Microbulbifer sp.]